MLFPWTLRPGGHCVLGITLLLGHYVPSFVISDTTSWALRPTRALRPGGTLRPGHYVLSWASIPSQALRSSLLGHCFRGIAFHPTDTTSWTLRPTSGITPHPGHYVLVSMDTTSHYSVGIAPHQEHCVSVPLGIALGITSLRTLRPGHYVLSGHHVPFP